MRVEVHPATAARVKALAVMKAMRTRESCTEWTEADTRVPGEQRSRGTFPRRAPPNRCSVPPRYTGLPEGSGSHTGSDLYGAQVTKLTAQVKSDDATIVTQVVKMADKLDAILHALGAHQPVVDLGGKTIAKAVARPTSSTAPRNSGALRSEVLGNLRSYELQGCHSRFGLGSVEALP